MSSKASPRVRLGVDERRKQLIELGLRMFGTRSYDEISIDDIADAAGISKGLLYHYFSSKRDFYVETVRAASEMLRSKMVWAPSVEPEERIRPGLEAYLDFVEQYAETYAGFLRSGIGVDVEVRAIVEATRDGFVEQMMATIGLTEHRPVFRSSLRGWIGLVEAVALDWIDHRDVSRAALLEILETTLRNAVAIAIQLDPVPSLTATAPESPERAAASQ